jgi:hypothetical protein
MNLIYAILYMLFVLFAAIGLFIIHVYLFGFLLGLIRKRIEIDRGRKFDSNLISHMEDTWTGD